MLSKLAAGLAIALLFVIVILLLSAIIKAITRTIRRVAVVRIIDGTLCFIVTFALALLLVALVAALMHTFDYVDVFKGKFSFTAMYTDKSPLNSAMEKAFYKWIAPALDNAKDAIKNLPIK